MIPSNKDYHSWIIHSRNQSWNAEYDKRFSKDYIQGKAAGGAWWMFFLRRGKMKGKGKNMLNLKCPTERA